MGFFRSQKKKKYQKYSLSKQEVSTPCSSPEPGSALSNSTASTTATTSANSVDKPAVSSSTPPSLDQVPLYLKELASSETPTSADGPARALRALFSLSEEHALELVRGSRTAPVLLDFLQRCETGSSEQYLTLLVLNNVSIPADNKRWIALDCGGVAIFCHLLCQNPSCHLLAIILVNLTFCDADFRNQLVQSSAPLMESLAFCLRYASMDHDPAVDGTNIMDGLRRLLSVEVPPHQPWLYPQTAKWCLTALKNLTRPFKDSLAARKFVNTGMVPVLLQWITVGGTSSDHSLAGTDESGGAFVDSPVLWDSASMQDAALFIVMNLCCAPSSRSYVRDLNAVQILSDLASYREPGIEYSRDLGKQLEFQCLKARMALSFLVGSEGHFGQPRRRTGSSLYSNPDESVLLMSEMDTVLLVELLANTLHNRAKEGPGGYSAATFNLKNVLFAIRCLVTHTANQVRFVNHVGTKLNALLVKVLALHAIRKTMRVDAEAAEHACFTLYLQSNYGFKSRFLPALYGNEVKIAGGGSLVAKILTSYQDMGNVTAAGRHAADQLLLRLAYLQCKGSVTDLANRGIRSDVSDFLLGEELLERAEQIPVERRRRQGTRPKDDIFTRPILRAPRKRNQKADWDNVASVVIFPSALEAVQQLSFGSTKVRHLDAIDDILIANNIANSANGLKTESYNYWWTWQDAAGEMHEDLARQRRTNEGSYFGVSDHDEPLSIFGLSCGTLCAKSTSP